MTDRVDTLKTRRRDLLAAGSAHAKAGDREKADLVLRRADALAEEIEVAEAEAVGVTSAMTEAAARVIAQREEFDANLWPKYAATARDALRAAMTAR